MTNNGRTTSANSYFKTADGHRRAAEILYPHTQNDNTPSSSIFFAFYNVLGFSVEMYLKAFLVNKGMVSETLSRRDFGHKLSVLYEEARTNGIYSYPGITELHPTVTVEPGALERIIQIIGPRFENFTFRYINDNEDTYEYIETMDIVWPIMNDLHERVRQSGITLELVDQSL